MGQAYAGFMKGVTRNAQMNPSGKVKVWQGHYDSEIHRWEGATT